MEIDRGVVMNVFLLCWNLKIIFRGFLMMAILPGLCDVAFRLTCSCSPVDNTNDLVFFCEFRDTLWCFFSFWDSRMSEAPVVVSS